MAGFPQYGFKADFSDDAFLSADLLKPAPGVRNATNSLLSSFVSSKTGTRDPVLSRAGILFRYRHSSLTALPQRSSLRSGLYCPCPSTLIDLIRPTHEHSPISQLTAGYTESLCCAGAPRPPASGSELSLLVLVSMQPSMTTENPPVAYTQFLHQRHSLHLRKKDSAFSSIPPKSVTSGSPFRG